MEPIEILNTINQFYDQAFNRLLIITFGLMAFIGVIIPIAVGWLQLRTLRAEKASLLGELKSEMRAEKEKIDQAIESKIQEKIESIKSIYDLKFKETSEHIEKSFAAAKGRAHHLQANNLLAENRDDLGFSDFCHATSLYFMAEEESNARRCIETIIHTCLPNLSLEHTQEYRIDDAYDCLVEDIEKYNQNSRYHDEIKSLSREMAKLKKKSAAPSNV